MTPVNRASSWLIGFALGGAAACAWFIAHVVWAWPWGWQVGVAVCLSVALAVPPTEWALQMLVSTRAAWLHPEQAFVEAVLGADDDTKLAPAQPASIVAGVLLTDWERHHVEGLLLVVRWAEAVQSFTSTALVGKAFRDNEHWQYWLDIMAASGLVIKSNGVPTVLAANKTYAWAKRQIIKATDIDFPPEYMGSPYPALPHPFSDGLLHQGKAPKGL